MKTKLIHKTLFKLTKIHEVHSIPGRLRIKIPGLELAKDLINPSEVQHLFQSYRLKGVHSLDVNFTSSKALVVFDETVTDKTQILKFMNRLREKIFDLFSSEGEVTPEEIDRLFSGLKEEGYVFEE